MSKWVDKRTGQEYSTVAVVAKVLVGVGLMVFVAGVVIVCIAFLLG